MRVVVAYDISHDDARARVAAILATWGDRIQRSVFECQLSAVELADVMERIGEIIDLHDDVVQVFRQCASCCGDRIDLGQSIGFSEDPYWVL